MKKAIPRASRELVVTVSWLRRSGKIDVTMIFLYALRRW